MKLGNNYSKADPSSLRSLPPISGLFHLELGRGGGSGDISE